MRTTTEQELDQKYEAILVLAYERGHSQGTHDRMSGYYNPTPLSGEWAGESPNEILGDLIRDATMLSAESQGLDEDGMDSAEGATDYAWEDVCNSYEIGYQDGNCD